MTQEMKPTKAGFAAILGAPNAGKSTLLNRFVGEKLSIVSRKAQTTRLRVLGILTEGDTQVGLIDTPGIFEPKNRLDKAMVRAAWDSLDGADAILLVVDAATRQPDAKAEVIVEALARRKVRASLALNKVDRVKREKLLPLAEHYASQGLFDKIFMISALEGGGVEDVKNHLLAAMPQGPWIYPEDQLTDLPERLLAAEVTREQILLQLHDELPYQAAVIPESWEERKDGSVAIRQTILVARVNHRMIVLGKAGAQIKKIGQRAREELAAQLDRPVHLFLEVRVDERWQERGDFYRLFGLEPSREG